MSMKRKFFKVASVAAITVVCGINVFNAQKSEALSDVALANVEALAQGETGKGNCSRAKLVVSCYRGNTWVGTRVKEIEYYDVVPGSMEECTHARITECPQGSEER